MSIRLASLPPIFHFNRSSPRLCRILLSRSPPPVRLPPIWLPRSNSFSTMTSTTQNRSYASAVEALNSLQSNAATIAAIRASGGKLNDFAIPEMVEYLQRIGYQVEELDRLNVIHITGTKGKGSTAAFSSSLLMKAFDGENRAKEGPRVGLYTSPHMMLVRERIRLDGLPLSEERFAKDFWHVWDRLEETADQRSHPEITPVRPVYFRFLTLLAFHTFLTTPSLKAVLLEVGIGGKYDSTNIVQRPVACGVSTLGLDHTAILGNTVEEIAEQKGGIYKQGSQALSVKQGYSSTEAVLKSVADQVGAPFKLLPSPPSSLCDIPLGLPGPHQVTNAHLALELVEAYLKSPVASSSLSVWSSESASTPSQWASDALKDARWPGRCQVVPTPSTGPVFFLDGAHTTDSLSLCTKWFCSTSSASKKQAQRGLIFNCTNGRSAKELLQSLLNTIKEQTKVQSYQEAAAFFDRVCFCTNITYKDGGSSGDLTSKAIDPSDLQALSVQRELQAAWQNLTGSTSSPVVQVLPSIEDAIQSVGELQADETHVLVAGSLHLVGGVMSHLKDQGALDEKLEASLKWEP